MAGRKCENRRCENVSINDDVGGDEDDTNDNDNNVQLVRDQVTKLSLVFDKPIIRT